jgi:ribulose bisphosphate carboxylase small subunit
MRFAKYITLFILSAGLVTSCNEDFLDKQPTDSLTNSTFWTSTDNAQKAVTAVYQFLGDEWWKTFLTAATDDSYAWSTWPSDVRDIANGSAIASSGTISHFWSFYYQAIASANVILDNIDQVPDMNEDTRAQMKAEVTFIRAYAYQQLVGTYGDVPLITTTPAGPSEYNVSRTSASEVMEYISTDLATVAPDLPVSYSSSDFGKITRGAALTLKARIDLYRGEYEEAATTAEAVMDLGVYSIDPDYLSIFNGTNEQSHEIILSAQYNENRKNSIATWVGGPFVGGWSEIVPLQSLVDAYECTDGKTIEESPLYDPSNPFANRDPRLAMTIVLPGGVVNGVTVDVTATNSPYGLGQNNASFSGYYFRKAIPTVVDGGYDSNSTNDLVVLRYAEVPLIYAEAKIELDEIDQSVYDAINMVRERADVNMPAITTGKSQDELRQILRRERHIEFAMEEQRFFDIRRWEIAENVMPGAVYGILNNFDNERSDYNSHVYIETRTFNPAKHYLWAIPQREISLNDNLVQNPNW